MRPWKLLAAAVLLVLAGCPEDSEVPSKPDVGLAFDGSLPHPGDGSVVLQDAEAPLDPDAQLPPGGDAGTEPTDGEVLFPGDADSVAEDAGLAPDDAGPTPTDDAGPAAPDGGPVLGPVGAPCSANGQCQSGMCIPAGAGWPDGYCSRSGCDAAADTSCLPYGGDGVCLSAAGSTYCLDQCSPAAPDCRAGYQCSTYGAVSLCEPAPVCGDGSVDFPEECEPPNTSTCDAHCQGTGTDPTGAACAGAASCLGNYCIDGWPDGYCTYYGCDPSAQDACAALGGGVCLESGGTGVCLQTCTPATSPSGCRSGYDCNDYGSVALCEPTPVCGDGQVDFPEECEPPGTATCDADCKGTGTDPTGSACADASTCAGNYCIAGWPGGYCTWFGCDLASPATSCSSLGGGVCLEVQGDGACFLTCDPSANPSDCRTGYVCNDYGTVALCEPAPVCGDGSVDFPEECEPPGTATCDASCIGKGKDPTGSACADAASCAGNYCIDRWPDGYCAHVGCDLASPDTSCDLLGGGVCMDAGGDGVCFQTCDPAASPSGCRTGYACNTYGAASVCEPAPVCGDGTVDFPEECEPPNTATCDANCVGSGTAATGSACASAGDCAGNYCIDTWPDGYCSSYGCDLANPGTSCGAVGGGVCVDVGNEGMCFQTCNPAASPSGCRTGYVCNDYGAVALCEPAPVCGDGVVDPPEECEPPGTATCDASCIGTGTAVVGAACASAADCAGNYCIAEADGFPGGYCTFAGCDLSAAATSCSAYGTVGGAVCLDIDSSGTSPYGMCFDLCLPLAPDCRTGYRCNTYGLVSLCEPGSPSPIGRACATAADCTSDTCLGTADGWPASGYCAQSGCDLANPTTSCPAGSFCWDIGSAATPRPMCLDTCSQGPSDPCATGLRCVKHGNNRLCEP